MRKANSHLVLRSLLCEHLHQPGLRRVEGHVVAALVHRLEHVLHEVATDVELLFMAQACTHSAAFGTLTLVLAL